MSNTHRMPSIKIRLAALASLGAALAIAGCSSSKSSAEDSNEPSVPSQSVPAVSTPPAATSAPVSTPAVSTGTGTGTGACKYLTVEQASELAQSPVKPGVERSVPTGPVTYNYCDYIFDPGNAPGVTIAIIDLGSDPAALFEQFRADKKASDTDYQVVPGVGDEAFYASQNLNILTGDTGVIIFVGRATGTPRGPNGIPDEKAAADIVLPQL